MGSCISTFMFELTEAAYILNYASAISLVIMDEIFCAIITLDGLAIAKACAEKFAHMWAFTLFETHYF
ncbi:MutS-related protein [Francisella tularensis]|uniref:MutS-related protein n=1 Tax=Francisella tularensis TaxID=263 RepID=UPI003877C927